MASIKEIKQELRHREWSEKIQQISVNIKPVSLGCFNYCHVSANQSSRQTKTEPDKKTSGSKQLQVNMNNSKKLQVTTTYSIKALQSKQPCNNREENHSRAAEE